MDKGTENHKEILIDINHVSYHIGNQLILKDIDINIHQQEIITIIGPNGAGKSTLLSLALGLKKPTTGKVKRQPKLRIGYVPQSVNRDYTMPVSVLDFVSLAKREHTAAEIQQLLERLSLSHLAQQFIHSLSGGELRRVLFVRALLNQPDLLVLDEPTAGVDVVGQKDFYHQLNELKHLYQFSILMVSHDLHLVMSTTDRVICLNKHICCQGKPDNVIQDPQYQALFGQQLPMKNMSELAFYEHHHDHTH